MGEREKGVWELVPVGMGWPPCEGPRGQETGRSGKPRAAVYESGFKNASMCLRIQTHGGHKVM